MEIERFPKWGDYMRILDLVEWQKDEHHKKPHKELRFCQFYRKAGGTNNDWIFGQGAGHMKDRTFYKLIHKARTQRCYGSFESVFDKFTDKRARRQTSIVVPPKRDTTGQGKTCQFLSHSGLSGSINACYDNHRHF